MSTIFFLHLQKTGGTSINHAAVEQFSRERVLMVYGNDSQWTSPAAKEIMKRSAEPAKGKFRALSDYIEENDIAFFSSHMGAAKLPCFTPDRAFTILRDPVERVISQYYFFRQKGRTDESLEAFSERPEYRGVQSRALRGVELESLAAVGVVERYDSFIAYLNQRLGLKFRAAHRKRGGLLKELRARMVGTSLRRKIAALNEDDAALYEQALSIVRERDG